MATIITVSSYEHKQWFFSTKHTVPEGLDNSWVPVTQYNTTKEEVAAFENAFGEEIKNPNSEQQA